MPRIVALLLGLALLGAGCGGASEESAEAGSDGAKLTLVAYSTPREVYAQLTKDFARTDAGRDVSFDESYGSSGEQSRAVESGLPADVVAFSLAPDVERLVEAGIVEETWADDEHGGMVTNSVVVFAVRKGNPKRIKTWDDLVKDGVEVIEPNPFTSGGARWNVMAAYGAQRKQGKTHDQAVEYLRQLFMHVSVQDKSARESLQTFTGGKGDVLLAYENEATLAKDKGEELEYVVPTETILIENPVAVTEDAPEQAAAFLEYIRSEEAQRVFAEAGYRPVNRAVAGEFEFPKPAGLFTIEDVGGWAEVQKRFFDREDGIMAGIQREVGAALE
ncbi:MAG: sulfate ABC transporter substrate-binding protein [Actinomycetota bacterium]|nr:sulfate ABC transporter substrate-binding protein [Actinomycetota bacterium]